jgi:hypothetical protein
MLGIRAYGTPVTDERYGQQEQTNGNAADK